MQRIFAEEGCPVALRATYFSMIEGGVGSRQYREIIVHSRRGPHNIFSDGRDPSAYFVSSILTLAPLISQGVHTTVFHTIEDMVQFQWYQIKQLVKGAVIVWDSQLCRDRKYHEHMGFCIGDGMAVSTDEITGIPTQHPVINEVAGEQPIRTIKTIFFHDKLRP